MIVMMIMMMTMMTNTIPYRRTKTHIWDKVLMGIWVHPITAIIVIINIIIIISIINSLQQGRPSTVTWAVSQSSLTIASVNYNTPDIHSIQFANTPHLHI